MPNDDVLAISVGVKRSESTDSPDSIFISRLTARTPMSCMGDRIVVKAMGSSAARGTSLKPICFACIYSVRGAGGYQMFGITPVPIFDPTQRLADFSEFMVFFQPGDIVKFQPIDESTYGRVQREVADGTYRYRQATVTFKLQDFLPDPDAYNAHLLEAFDAR